MANRVLRNSCLLGGILLFSVGALVINIQTMPVMNDIKLLQRQIRSIEEENNRLQYQISQKTNYKALQQRIATMGLIKPKFTAIKHVVLPKKQVGDE